MHEPFPFVQVKKTQAHNMDYCIFVHCDISSYKVIHDDMSVYMY